MDTTLLRKWLGLPPGDWPPDDRTLLGFPPGPLTPDDVEVRALEKMELLRPHQLTEPDLVTEGMNRLAQAMIGLTDAPAAPPPPPKPKKAKKPKPASDPELATIDLRRDVNDPGFMIAEIVDAEPEPLPQAVVLDAQPVTDAKVPPKPKRPKAFRAPDRLPPEPLKLDEVPSSAQEPPAPPAGLVVVPSERRKAYKRLVRLRRLIRGLDSLRPFYGDPSEPLLTPVRLYGFVEAIQTFREADGTVRNWPVTHGLLVRRLASDGLPVGVFRSLVASQRKAVAADWARAKAELEDEYKLARESLRTSRPHSRWATEWRNAKAWLLANPEWLPGLLFLVAFAVALARTAARPR